MLEKQSSPAALDYSQSNNNFKFNPLCPVAHELELERSSMRICNNMQRCTYIRSCAHDFLTHWCIFELRSVREKADPRSLSV